MDHKALVTIVHKYTKSFLDRYQIIEIRHTEKVLDVDLIRKRGINLSMGKVVQPYLLRVVNGEPNFYKNSNYHFECVRKLRKEQIPDNLKIFTTYSGVVHSRLKICDRYLFRDTPRVYNSRYICCNVCMSAQEDFDSWFFQSNLLRLVP
ncbi:hypothetical protein [Carp edema virus]|nr:hypothetical protein [Carp edema virus]